MSRDPSNPMGEDKTVSHPLENGSSVVCNGGPGIFRQCLHCGKFAALQFTEEVRSSDGSILRKFMCHKCGETECYLVQGPTTSRKKWSIAPKDEDYHV